MSKTKEESDSDSDSDNSSSTDDDSSSNQTATPDNSTPASPKKKKKSSLDDTKTSNDTSTNRDTSKTRDDDSSSDDDDETDDATWTVTASVVVISGGAAQVVTVTPSAAPTSGTITLTPTAFAGVAYSPTSLTWASGDSAAKTITVTTTSTTSSTNTVTLTPSGTAATQFVATAPTFSITIDVARTTRPANVRESIEINFDAAEPTPAVALTNTTGLLLPVESLRSIEKVESEKDSSSDDSDDESATSTNKSKTEKTDTKADDDSNSDDDDDTSTAKKTQDKSGDSETDDASTAKKSKADDDSSSDDDDTSMAKKTQDKTGDSETDDASTAKKSTIDATSTATDSTSKKSTGADTSEDTMVTPPPRKKPPKRMVPIPLVMDEEDAPKIPIVVVPATPVVAVVAATKPKKIKKPKEEEVKKLIPEPSVSAKSPAAKQQKPNNDKADDDKVEIATGSHMSGLVNVSLEVPVDRSQEDAVMFGEKSQVEAVRKSQVERYPVDVVDTPSKLSVSVRPVSDDVRPLQTITPLPRTNTQKPSHFVASKPPSSVSTSTTTQSSSKKKSSKGNNKSLDTSSSASTSDADESGVDTEQPTAVVLETTIIRPPSPPPFVSVTSGPVLPKCLTASGVIPYNRFGVVFEALLRATSTTVDITNLCRAIYPGYTFPSPVTAEGFREELSRHGSECGRLLQAFFTKHDTRGSGLLPTRKALELLGVFQVWVFAGEVTVSLDDGKTWGPSVTCKIGQEDDDLVISPMGISVRYMHIVKLGAESEFIPIKCKGSTYLLKCKERASDGFLRVLECVKFVVDAMAFAAREDWRGVSCVDYNTLSVALTLEAQGTTNLLRHLLFEELTSKELDAPTRADTSQGLGNVTLSRYRHHVETTSSSSLIAPAPHTGTPWTIELTVTKVEGIPNTVTSLSAFVHTEGSRLASCVHNTPFTPSLNFSKTPVTLCVCLPGGTATVRDKKAALAVQLNAKVLGRDVTVAVCALNLAELIVNGSWSHVTLNVDICCPGNKPGKVYFDVKRTSTMLEGVVPPVWEGPVVCAPEATLGLTWMWRTTLRRDRPEAEMVHVAGCLDDVEQSKMLSLRFYERTKNKAKVVTGAMPVADVENMGCAALDVYLTKHAHKPFRVQSFLVH